MANLAAAVVNPLGVAVVIASGIATRFDPLVMDAVVQNRARWNQIDLTVEVVGYVALLDCDRIGQLVWLEAPDGRIVGPVMVADCAAAHHRQARIAQGFAVDLSWELAQELGVVNGPRGGFVIWDADPRRGTYKTGAGPLSSTCHPANGAGGPPLPCSGPAPF